MISAQMPIHANGKAKSDCSEFRTTTQYGALEGKTQSNEVKYYNLDVIISVVHHSP